MSENDETISYVFRKKHLRIFYYEDSYSNACPNGEEEQTKLAKIQGIYALLGGIVLLASICLIGFDIVMHKPIVGETYRDSPIIPRRHHNSPVSSLSGSSPLLSPREFWI